ncbi:hypothetical protein ATANTOWER_017402 [Ataeniobius toweri]|uniref:Secreted protein n=1 Tax=Ataeniobius toweri TaxID=208326 RepID=A0ABU7C850_9TELE|nr:hypothetical protein [Ataeniobius toweri]
MLMCFMPSLSCHSAHVCFCMSCLPVYCFYFVPASSVSEFVFFIHSNLFFHLPSCCLLVCILESSISQAVTKKGYNLGDASFQSSCGASRTVGAWCVSVYTDR